MKSKRNKASRPGTRGLALPSGSTPTSSPIRLGCPIVGVGASAGGLEAFTQLLQHLPVDTGFAFVLVQHLDPQHASVLPQILTRATSMAVHEATHRLRVRPNNIYVIRPNTRLGIAAGVLQLQPRSRDRTALRTIDYFFEALAHDQRERAIGVILSGTATDGTLGLEAIKAEGGLTFAQDDSARFDSMPRNAAVAGCVDLVLAPPAIAKELARIAKHPYVTGWTSGTRSGRRTTDGGGKKSLPLRGTHNASPPAASSIQSDDDAYQEILLLLRKHSGVDFALYKSSTIRRRITRRTLLNQQTTLASYTRFLRDNAKELDALYADILINVTSFFRNGEAFDSLKQKIFAKLLQQRSDGPVRIWVLGCSTGQEAYSIAMAFAESAERLSVARKLQIFATDLSEANLVKARHGFYAKTLVQDLSPERLRRFFVEEDGGYRVIKPLRESVVFARQNVISDPPFSRLDLISCRNVMIYLEAGLQQKVLPTFHYALKPDGFLLLGASESIGGFGNLFGSVDKRQKIFFKKSGSMPPFQLPLKNASDKPLGTISPARAVRAKSRSNHLPNTFGVELNAEREADRVIANQFARPSVLISADLQILQFRGATGAYLGPPMGKASLNLLKMAREGLMLPLRAVINRAKRSNDTARLENIAFRQDGQARSVNVSVVPLKNLKQRCFLVLFEESSVDSSRRGGAAATEPTIPSATKRESSRVVALERDLSEARDYLQSVQEHQDTANEALQASNEESQSANEELQSLNEELETSKEELESTNEELITVNEEMTNRNAELNRLNSDLTNVETATKFVILLLNRDLTVRRFSAQAGQQFNLLASDVGRPINAVRHNLDLPELDAIITEVVTRVHGFEREVRDHGGRWHSLRVRPYVTVDNKVDGAVLVLVDIDELKQAERRISEAQVIQTDKLEKLVAHRTAELTASNRRLGASVESVKKGQEQYRMLFLESQAMQKKLRHLTHQILATQEEERKKISRELHDEVVQTLVGINIELTAVEKEALAGGRGLAGKIGHTRQLVEESVQAVHRFARGLRPAVLDDLGLTAALHAFCKNLATQKKIIIKLAAFRGIEALGGDERTVLFRVAQEALTNVSRHAHASQVRLTLSKVTGAVRMAIADNGKSFDVEKTLQKQNNKRLGLVGMRERIEMIGGTLTIESVPGVGTTVRVEVPYVTAGALSARTTSDES